MKRSKQVTGFCWVLVFFVGFFRVSGGVVERDMSDIEVLMSGIPRVMSGLEVFMSESPLFTSEITNLSTKSHLE